MSAIDKVISFISPRAGFNRARYRLASEAVADGMRKFDAAAKTRRTDGWHATSTSANGETVRVLATLRNRSRELVRNNAYAKRAIQSIRNNAVGTGIRPTPSKKAGTKAIMEAWWQWAETKQCDFAGKETFYGLQKLIIGTIAQDGEVIVRKRRTDEKGSVIPIKLQVCEVDQLDDSREEVQTKSGGWIIQGVEYDKTGKLIGYWLYDRHPGDTLLTESKFVAASDVLHIFLQERPGQVRGIPWSHSVMIRMRDFDDFEDAQLMQQKIAACFAVFVEKDTDSGLDNADPNYEQSERVEPGIIEHLRPGEKVSFGTPPSVSGQDAFSKKVLQAIASGYGISYEELTGDLGNVNFSSGRMGWINMYRNVVEWQTRILIPQFCDPAWEWFLAGCNLKGISVPAGLTAEWTPPKREMIDPTKEINGFQLMVENQFSSWQEVVRSLGADPDTVLTQIRDDQKNFEKYGVKKQAKAPADPAKKDENADEGADKYDENAGKNDEKPLKNDKKDS